ncbi:nucleotidyl transferase AbiEii/AbiGii toxin family protein [Pseudoalteromonas distincta]|uniref:Nucleotidyl transferase AbiEii/AbiGii toxin family protein n=2 Tax=Pseudoalteromonas TaxID=53246 RepID=A0ABT9GFC9_9GAMM|nr:MULTISPECIES: nucleotidyl transferase AbiEii/AbiGii toxin family protein [Pseudoalteromonas distincta group]MDP4484584.1 nucleotidyl transferase AbiEii/AbiGii toxin family protein [Pseudoalteromonas elyakovii]
MKSTSLNVVGKLPRGLVDLYQKINAHTEALGIPYLVIGATARDIILHHGYGAAIERGTRDIDFGIQVQNWDQFEQLKEHLLKNGFTPAQTKVHQLVTTVPNGESWEIDIIPFGNIAGDGNSITWPPQHDIGMSVTGFNEAFKHALDVEIANNPNLNIKVASPAGMLLLKLISWLEREHSVRRKDAMDIFYLTRHYSKIPDIADSLYEDDFMDAQNYDEHKASTMKLATDACSIANEEVLSFINEKLFNIESKVDNLVLDISRAVQIEYSDAEELLSIISEQLNTA